MVQWQDVDPGDRPGDRDQSYRPTPIWDHAGAPTVIRQTVTDPAIQSLKQRQGNVEQVARSAAEEDLRAAQVGLAC